MYMFEIAQLILLYYTVIFIQYLLYSEQEYISAAGPTSAHKNDFIPRFNLLEEAPDSQGQKLVIPEVQSHSE